VGLQTVGIETLRHECVLPYEQQLAGGVSCVASEQQILWLGTVE